MMGCTILVDFQRGWQPYLHHAATRTAWKPLLAHRSPPIWPADPDTTALSWNDLEASPPPSEQSAPADLSHSPCLPSSPSAPVFPFQGFFFICCCFLQPANPLIQSSLCCCCLSCVSFLCILSPGGPQWEAGDDSCISSRS